MKKIKNKRTLMAFVVIAALAVVLFIVEQQGYTKMNIGKTYSIGNVTNSSYKEFRSGVIKYSRDGAAYFDANGQELWNQSYQMKSPFVETNDLSAAIADEGGNDIFVFQEDGVIGEIHTTLPIEKISISEQGIVAAVLKNQTAPKIQCFDLAGNILVEHKATIDSLGYPISVSLSNNGENMQVVYLQIKDMKVASRVCYYNFGEDGSKEVDHQVANVEYEDNLMATGFYLDEDTSAAIGEQGIVFFKGKDKPKEDVKIQVKEEIQSIFYRKKYIGMIVKSSQAQGYEMRLYSSSGKQVFSEPISGLYGNVRISGRQIIMHDGRKCCVYSLGGRKVYEGELENQIYEIIPVLGFHKYAIINANGMQIGRFAK